MGVNTPKRRGQGRRELRDIIRDLRSMLGHVGKRDKEIVLESIEALQDLAQRLYAAETPTRRLEHSTEVSYRKPEIVLTRVDAAENEAHGEEETYATGKP